MDRKAWDKMISASGLVIAIVLIVVGALAIYGGNFGRQSVQDRLTPERVSFPPLSSMTAAEQASVGKYAGQLVDTGPEAEAFSRYIAGHLAEVNGGKTYSETSAAARADGLDADRPPRTCSAKADTLFKGETLRSILLNAYGWWTVATIALFAGIFMVLAGIAMAFLSFLGFRHAGRRERAGHDHGPRDGDRAAGGRQRLIRPYRSKPPALHGRGLRRGGPLGPAVRVDPPSPGRVASAVAAHAPHGRRGPWRRRT